MRNNTPITQRELEVSSQANILSTTNLKSQITYINDDFIKYSGFTKEELIEQPHNIIRHPDMPEAVFKMFWADLKAEQSWMGIVKNRCKNGDHYWVDAFATPIKKGSQVDEYQSVRRKAKKAYVTRAQKAYAAIKQGKPLTQTKGSLATLPMLQLACILPYLLVLIAWWLTSDAAYIAISAGVATITSTGLVALIFHPFLAAILKSKSISTDNVARYVYTGRRSEAGHILLALKKLESENAALIGRIHDMTGVLAENAATLSSAVEQSRQGTVEQFEQTEMVASAVEQMTVSIDGVATSVQDTAATTDNAVSLAKSGQGAVKKTATAIQGLQAQLQSSSRTVASVSERSGDIEKILDVIIGIAEQTNLLALNAAIEAARAGESGRGFAVVADEVRSLASRTQDSTREIRAVIEALQTEVSKAVESIGEGESMAEESVNLSAQTEHSLTEILTAIEQISAMGNQIARATQEQSSVATDISQSVIAIRDNAQQNLDGIEQSAQVAAKTQRVTERLEQLTQQFWDSQSNQSRA